MRKVLLTLATLVAALQATEPTSKLLSSTAAKDGFSYLMVGAAAPLHSEAMEVIAPNLAYGARHFSGIHAKDYFLGARINQQMQSIVGQYSFLFFPITTKSFAKTHSALYIGAGLTGGVTYLSKEAARNARAFTNILEIKRRIKKEATDQSSIATIIEDVQRNKTPQHFMPVLDLPLTIGYQFASSNFVQMQFSTVAYIANRVYELSGNGIYATLNYGFGF